MAVGESDPARRVLLVTGFGPFAGDDHNPSGVIAARVDGVRIAVGDDAVVHVRGVVLPVSTAKLDGLLLPLLDGVVGALGLGVALGRTRVTLERYAFNEKSFRTADVDGACPEGEPIEARGPTRVEASLPVEAIAQAWIAAEIPTAPSEDPGRHLCNQWLYTVRRRKPELAAGFLHVPADERLALHRDVPWVPIDHLERTVRLALDAFARAVVPGPRT